MTLGMSFGMSAFHTYDTGHSTLHVCISHSYMTHAFHFGRLHFTFYETGESTWYVIRRSADFCFARVCISHVVAD